MTLEKFNRFVLRVVSIAILVLPFSPASYAGPVDTSYLLEVEARSATLDRIEVLLARSEVAEQLQQFGVSAADVEQRLQGMTAEELIEIEGHLGQDIAGGDAIGIIGTVFLVLIILELVGVTDVFKAF